MMELWLVIQRDWGLVMDIKKILIYLIIFSFLFAQETIEPVLLDDGLEECEPCPEPCDGQCLSDEVIQTLYVSIQELEHADTTNQKIIENLNSQIYIYIQTMENDSLMIEDYIKKLELKEDMIDLVKPKWYENRYLWFGYGVTLTVGSVILAGQLK